MNDSETFDDTIHAWRGKTLLLAGLAALIVIATLIATLISANRQRDAALRFQREGYEAMILASDLQTTMAGAEAALGRYVISADKTAGALYADRWRRAGVIIDSLETSTTDDARQQALIVDLRKAYAERDKELSAVALRTTYGQNPQALSKFYTAGQSSTLPRLIGITEQVRNNQRMTLNARTSAAQASQARANMIGALIAGFGLLLLLGAAYLAWNSYQAWAARRAEARRSAALDEAVEERTAALTEAHRRLVDEMTERQAAEEKLHQAHKMEAVGRLTGGIAHDFNNMLAVVIGGIELAERRMATDCQGAKRHLDQALEGANRAATLTKRLLAFARAEPLLPTAINPQQLITDMTEMIDRTLGDDISVSVACNARSQVFIDKHQLENALLNLAVNARDAMETGGKLSISADDVTIGDGEVTDLAAGNYVRISVSDTGSGMTPEVQARIFEPFFTTKDVGKGTGLGLSQIFGFVRQSNGGIAVNSVVGAGTTISIYLPHHDASVPDEAPTQPTTAPRAATANVKVLVIEDDARVLAATTAAVKELGHHPLPCASAREVPEILRNHRDIGLIISDVVMPGVSGPDLVAAIHTLNPHIPAMFVTGFAGDIDNADVFGGHEVLRKPFTIAALNTVIDRVLTAADAQDVRAA